MCIQQSAVSNQPSALADGRAHLGARAARRLPGQVGDHRRGAGGALVSAAPRRSSGCQEAPSRGLLALEWWDRRLPADFSPPLGCRLVLPAVEWLRSLIIVGECLPGGLSWSD